MHVHGVVLTLLYFTFTFWYGYFSFKIQQEHFRQLSEVCCDSTLLYSRNVRDTDFSRGRDFQVEGFAKTREVIPYLKE
jgi:hypothetical protein